MSSRAKGTIWTERTLVALILASLAGALFLTISVYRRAFDAPSPTSVQPQAVVAAAEPETEPEPIPPSPVIAEAAPTPPAPEPAPEPAPPQEDPTEKALAELSEATAREIAEANRLDQRLRELEAAKRAAIAESDKWRRRDMLVKRQIAEMTRRAEIIDRQTDQYAAQRDVLARERDALKAAHAKADGRGSYAVLPYKGPNGTWRRPIVLECVNGTVALKPNGPTFNMLDLSGLVNPRSSPIIVAIARELLKVQASDSPDGAPVVPYFVFLVRPDGIRPYYEARARLEPLGIAFGYELIDQDLQVDVPDYDDLATWDGSPGGDVPSSSVLAGGAFAGDGSGDGSSPDIGLTWPGAPAGTFDSPEGSRSGRTNGGGDGDSPDDFIWSGAPRGRFRNADSPTGSPSPGGVDSPIGASSPGNADLPTGSSSGGLGRQSRGRGLASAVDALPDFEPAEDRARPGLGDRGGRSTLDAGELGAEGRGGGGNSFDPKGVGGSEKPPAGRGSAGAGEGGGVGDESGKGRGPIGSANLVGLEPASTTTPGAPGASGLMWGDDPSLAAGTASENGTGTNRETSGKVGSSSSSSSSGTNEGAGVGSGPRPLIAMGADGGSAGGKPGGGSPPSGLGVGLSSLGELAELLGGAAPGGGAGASEGGSGLMIGSDAGSTSSNSSSSAGGDPSGTNDALDQALAGSRISDGPATIIEVPFEITVVCGADGVTIQPGGYRITASALREGRADKLLVRHLASAVRRRALADPTIRPRPRVKFLVERDGGSNFWEARKQVLFADLSWPMTLQVAGGRSPRLFDHEAWR